MKFTAALRLSLLALLILISSVVYGQETYYYEFNKTSEDKNAANPFGTVNNTTEKTTKTAMLGAIEWSATSRMLYSNGRNLQISSETNADEEVLLETSKAFPGIISLIEVYATATKNGGKVTLTASIDGNDCGTVDIKVSNPNNSTYNLCTFTPSTPSSGKVSLTFKQDVSNKRGVYILYIRITYTTSLLSLAEDSDNTTTINDNNGKTTSVQVARTFTADGGWYTLCLPFGLNKEQIESVFGSNTDVEAMTGIQTDNESVTAIEFSSVDATNAGTAYIVKPTQTVENPTFTSVTLSNDAPTATNFAGYQFIGVYSPTTISADGYHRLLSGTDGLTLRKAADDNTQLKATRGYFIFPNDNTQGAKIYIGGTTSINGIAVDKDATAADAPTYTLQGIKVGGNGQLPKGIYIRQGKKILVR